MRQSQCYYLYTKRFETKYNKCVTGTLTQTNIINITIGYGLSLFIVYRVGVEFKTNVVVSGYYIVKNGISILCTACKKINISLRFSCLYFFFLGL